MPPDTSSSSTQRASALFDAWLDQLESGEESEFSLLLERHPECAAELSALHARWQRLDAELGSALPGPLAGESFFRSAALGESRGEGDAPVSGRQARPSPPGSAFDPAPGRVLGDYRLLRPIAQGGMGSVWEAEQLSLRRRVALKLLRPGKGAPRLLLREARAAGRLDHPGVVPVFAVGEEQGTTFIAQQLVGDGFTLAGFLDRTRRAERLPPDYDRRIARLVAGVADAVHAAHEAGVLHRDLKPQNILIDDEDRPRVTDFGLAHVREDGGDVARPGVLGTVAYMSPEQAAGKDIEIDRRSDVFGLGAVFWEALTLRRAFEGDTAEAVLRRVLAEDPPDPRTIRSRVPRELALICAKALRKPRSLRYGSMKELADDLRRFLANEPIHAQPETPLAVGLKWTRRHPAWSASLALGGAALVVISVLLAREIDLRRDAQDAGQLAALHAREAEEAADLARRRAAEARRQSYLANLRAASAAFEQGGWAEAQRLLAACPEEHRGWEWTCLALRAQASLLDLSGHADDVLAVAMTPDGRRVVTGCADGTLHVWDGVGGARLGVLSGHHGPVRSVAIVADGSRALSAGDDGTVRLWDVEHGRPLQELSGHRGPVRAVAVSADGRLAVSAGDDGIARAWNLADGTTFAVGPQGGLPLASVAIDAGGTRFATASRYGTIDVFDAADGGNPARLAYYEGPDAPLAFSPDGRLLADGTGDGHLRVRDIASGELVLEVAAHAAAVRSLAWSGDGKRLVSLSGADNAPRSWDATTGAALGERHGHEGQLVALATDARGTRVAACGLGGHAWIWLADNGPAAVPLPPLAGPVTALASDATGHTLLATTVREDAADVLDGLTGRRGARLPAGRGPNSLALDATGEVAATASLVDEVVRIWDPRTGEPRGTLTGAKGGITALSISADGHRLLAASQDARLRAWELPSGRLLATLEGHASLVSSATLSADGHRAASASVDGTVRVWDVDAGTGRVLSEAGWFEDALVTLSADGRRVASASLRADTALVWDADSGRELATLAGHGTGVGALLLSPDGTRVFSASTRDAAVRVWDADGGDLLLLLSGHAAPVTALALGGDGRRLFSGASDGTLLAWEGGPGH